MNIEDGSLYQLDLEYITWFAVLHRMKNKNSFNMHDFLTSLEGLVPAYSTKFLEKLKREFKSGVEFSTENSREFNDTIIVIDRELEKRNNEQH